MTVRRWVESVSQDCRHSLRLMRRSPVFFGAAMLTLALGIGANGAVFSVLQAVLLQPLPYDEASRLVMLWHAEHREVTRASATQFRDRLEFSGPMVMSVRDAAHRQFGEVAAGVFMRSGGQLGSMQGDLLESALDLSIGDRPVRLNGASVTPNFFRVLGVRAAIGRVFDDRDDNSSEASIVLSDATWRREFGADPGIVGRSITITSGMPRVSRVLTVVGVLPRGVHFTYPQEVEAWLVKRWSDVARSDPYAVGEYLMVSRIRPGLSTEQARTLISSMSRDPLVAPANARGGENDRLGLTPMREWIVGDTRPSLYLLGAVAALLLLVTCVTVSNGLLARISERRQELAVRSAVGAERSRILQQLLVEGAILSIGGTIVGIVLVILIAPLLRAMIPASLPQVGELRFNGSVVVFAAVMATVTTILAAVAPAWGGTRHDAAASLSRAAVGSTANRSSLRWRHALVGAQAALTTVLLIFSALLLSSLWRLGQVPLGFDPHDVLAVDLQLLDAKYRAPDAIFNLQQELLRGVREIPGVVDAGLTSAIPFRGFDSRAQVRLPDTDRMEIVRVRYVDSAYFAALRVPVIRGRLLSGDDRSGSSAVAIVSESFARGAFGAASPIGKVIPLDRPTQIVGVVGNLRYAGMDKESSPAVYVPSMQHPRILFTMVVRIDPTTGRIGVVSRIRDTLRELDPTLPALNIATLDQIIDATMVGRRFYSVATGAFALVALVLTTVGLALVVARAVAERRRELAIRGALGATAFNLARAAVGDAVLAIASGVTVGLLLAGIGSVLLAQFLFQIAARAPVVYVGAAMAVMIVASAAAWLPLRRFARIPLAQLLRQD